MRSKIQLLASLLAVLFLAAAVLTGCGAGNQSKSGGSNGGSGQAKQEQTKKGAKGKGLSRKIALGTIVAVNAKTNKFVLNSSNPKSGQKPMKFRAGKAAKIVSGGKKAGFSAIKKGEQAKITYVVKNGKNRARLVQLPGGSNGKTPGGQTTG